MKSKRAVAAFVLCIALAVMPLQALAATGESIGVTRQECLDKMDYGVAFLSTDRGKYSAIVWKEITAEFDRVKTEIMQSEDPAEMEDICDEFMNVMSELGAMTLKKVPEGMPLSSVKKLYVQQMKELYRSLNREEYSEYYWDGIDEAYHISLKGIRAAKSLTDISRAYVSGAEVLMLQVSTDTLEGERTQHISDLKGYMTDEFRKEDYPSNVWKEISGAYDKALKALVAAQDEEEMEIARQDALDILEKYSGISIAEYESIRSSYVDDKVADLVAVLQNLDRSLYSEKGIARIEGIVAETVEKILNAASMKDIDKLCRSAYSRIGKVKTAKQEVPGERERAERILRKYLNNPKYDQERVKPVIQSGIQALSKCQTLDLVARTLQKYQTKAEKTAYTFRIQSSAGTGGTITKSKKVVYGDSARFKMQPDAGYKVAGVWVDGTYVGVRHSYTFTKVKKTHTIRVEFKKK